MRKALILIIMLCGIATTATAQFYYEGTESGRTKWNRIETSRYKLLHPKGFEQGARRYASILDKVYPHINYNLGDTVRKLPIILRTNNQLSNGFVSWAPKRTEMVTNLSGDTYALSWDKQISIHEARHVAQLSTMKTGMTKVMSWFLGEAGISIGLLVVHKWQLEGDAVIAETQFAEYGRGLQPDFTLGYRGIASAGKLNLKKNIDPWIHGSYKKYIPNIYEYGYQVLSAAETYLSPTIWHEVVDYSAKYPIFLFPRTIYLRRKYNTSYKQIAVRAFSELDSIWRPTYEIDENFRILTPQRRIYTKYSDPLPYQGHIIATKWDMDKPSRFVAIDTTTLNEHLIRSVGYVTSRPVVAEGKLYWTEYKPHIFFNQKNYSVVRSVDLLTRKRSVYSRRDINYYVTPLPDGNFATVTHDSQSRAYIRITDPTFDREINTIHFSETTTLHSLTWDNSTERLYYIALSDRGMWIGSSDLSGNKTEITTPSVVTIRDLNASRGKLYFSSIQSGKNEIHTLDLSIGKEYRQTTSRLGSIMPRPEGHGKEIIFSTYTPEGWALASSSATSDVEQVEWSRLPRNILNPKRHQWNVSKIDSYSVDTDSTSLNTHNPSRYRRGASLVNVHSWAPIPFTGDIELIENSKLELNLGVTAFFQSPLSEIRGSASYGWINKMEWFKANAVYSALPVQIDITAEYGGGYQSVYLPSGNTTKPPQLERKPYFGVNASFSLPMNMTKGANIRLLQPSITLSHFNSRYYRDAENSYGSDVQIYNASLYWSDILSRGSRCIIPRLGYAVRASAVGALHKDFSTVMAFTSQSYLPGIARNQSISVALTGQYQMEHNSYKLSSKSLIPRGVTNTMAAKTYTAIRSSYVMPLVYPDGGIENILYLRRISAEIFGDYSHGKYYVNHGNGYEKRDHYSYGVILGIENTLFGMIPNTAYITLARTSKDKFWFGISYSMNF